MPEKETLDKVLDCKLNYQDDETPDKPRRLYYISISLWLDGYKNNKLHKNYDSYEVEIKSGIKSAIKTGYSRIILSYDPSKNYFSIHAMNWPQLPKIFGSDTHTNSVMKTELRFSWDSCLLGHFDELTTFYKPGKWEGILEKEYKERMGEYVKSPVSPEARKQIARQKPTVQILDDKEASTAQNRSHSSDWFWDENAPGYPRHP